MHSDEHQNAIRLEADKANKKKIINNKYVQSNKREPPNTSIVHEKYLYPLQLPNVRQE